MKTLLKRLGTFAAAVATLSCFSLALTSCDDDPLEDAADEIEDAGDELGK